MVLIPSMFPWQSSDAIIVDGKIVKQEPVDIKPGSEIVSGPQKEGNIVLHDIDSKSLCLCLCGAEQTELFHMFM